MCSTIPPPFYILSAGRPHDPEPILPGSCHQLPNGNRGFDPGKFELIVVLYIIYIAIYAYVMYVLQ